MKKQVVISVIAIFVVLTALFMYMKQSLPQYQFAVLETANGIMAALSLITYMLIDRQIDGRPNAFVRSVYSASFLKLMVCMISILVYVLLNRATIHKPTVFVMFGIYALYTITETWLLSKIVRDKQ